MRTDRPYKKLLVNWKRLWRVIPGFILILFPRFWLLAEQYDRLMHYDSMWSALNTLNDSQRVDGRWYYYALRAAVFTNRLEDARLIARKGTQLFPQHEEIKALRVELDPVYREALSDKLSVPDGPAVSEILLRRLILATSPDKRPPLIQRYIDMGYDDPRIHLLRDFISENPDGLDITFMLKEQYLQSLFSFRQVYLLFEQEERVDEFREFCEDRRIKIREDRNSDGYEDAVYILEDARLVEVGKDLDQDSIQEIVIRFNTGSEAPFVPKNLSLRYDEKYYFFTYGRYPEILSVKIDGPDSVQEFSFAESVFTMDAVEYEHLPPFAELDYGGIPGDRELEDRAFRYVSYDASGTVRRDTSGAKIREENGQTVKILSHGEETWIERDLDGDGQSEIREIYRDNSLYGVYLDQDGNGISEYFYYPSQSLQAWDWDQDGKLDYQSYNGN